MKLSKKQKRLLIITGIIVGVLAVAVISINIFLATVIRGKIDEALNKNTTDYHISIKRVGVNILTGNLNIRGLKIIPDSSLINDVKQGKVNLKFIQHSEIGLFRIAGVDIYKAIVKGEIYARKILFKDADIRIYKGPKPSKALENLEDKSNDKFNPDSIYIAGLNKINLHEIDLIKCKLQIFDLEKDKKLFSTGNLNLNLHSVDFVTHPDNPNVFRMKFSKFKAGLSVKSLLLPGGWYFLDVENLYYNNADNFLQIDGLALHPTYKDKYKMAKAFGYTKEIFDLDIDKIYIKSFDLFQTLVKNELIIDSIGISGLDVSILKDKRYPFNTTLRPKLPNQQLKHLDFPVYIKTISLKGGNLVYQEKMKDVKELMTASMGNLDLDIRFVTSVKDSIRTGKPMKAVLKADFMKKVPLRIDFVFPLKRVKDTFYFSGSLGSAQLSVFNQASFPAIGLKFEKGRLNSLNFKGGANDSVSRGEMTMLYQDMAAEVVKKDRIKKNKFLSWAADAVSHTGNPGKKGKTRVAVMNFNRVMYKGFGNFMWKTLQTGIVNTVSPVGKTVKEDKSQKKQQKQKAEKQDQAKKQEKKKSKSKSKKKNKKSGRKK
ncbi:MAG: hypothetical protein GXO86_14370 [Chlorobi bacterium]|nr:hypothetical protein [Chlorobiota bacterium]